MDKKVCESRTNSCSGEMEIPFALSMPCVNVNAVGVGMVCWFRNREGGQTEWRWIFRSFLFLRNQVANSQ